MSSPRSSAFAACSVRGGLRHDGPVVPLRLFLVWKPRTAPGTRPAGRLVLAGLIWFLGTVASVASVPSLRSLSTPATHRRWELSVEGVPASTNPFDPDRIRVEVAFEAPDGTVTRVPAFWSQDHTRRLSGSAEVLTPSGDPGWRVRFRPVSPGVHRLTCTVLTNGVAAGAPGTSTWEVSDSGAVPPSGPARVASSGVFFEGSDGKPMPLVGVNLGWHGIRGTYDYDDWIPALAARGVNHVRVWMCPWAFGLETGAGTLTRYRLDRAFQLDRVLELAERHGVQVQLCLDYHGMYRPTPDPVWGGLDDWRVNPYSTALGGPAADPNGFFTSESAVSAYRKRLRYLVARYGSSPSLFAWEFFNEIDLVYAGNGGTLDPAAVARWHRDQAAWLSANDPFRHLVTTSLSGGDRADLWSIPGLHFVNHHTYGAADPGATLAATVARLRSAYGKPVVVGEFGVDSTGWARASDPYLRGFRQHLWAGITGGGAGTAMSWWWENLVAEDVLPLLGHVRSVTRQVPWGAGPWTPMAFVDPGPPPPTVVEATAGAAAFPARLVPGTAWGAKPRGTFAVPDPNSAEQASRFLNAFLHGSAHPELKVPLRIQAAFDVGARVVARVNSVSAGARLGFYVDGSLVTSTNLPDRDGRFDAFVGEYGIDVGVAVPSGVHTVEIRNLGTDWATLDWIEASPLRRTVHAGGWMPSPGLTGIARGTAALVYLWAPGVAWPAGATNASPERLAGRKAVFASWPSGGFVARWFDPATGAGVGTTSAETSATGTLELPVPEFAVDLAAVVLPRPRLTAAALEQGGTLRLELEAPGAPEGIAWTVESSTDLGLGPWTPRWRITNGPNAALRLDLAEPVRFHRAVPAAD